MDGGSGGDGGGDGGGGGDDGGDGDGGDGGGDGDGDGGGDARLPVLMVVQGFPPLAVSNLKWVIRCWRRTSLPSGTTPPGTEQ